MYLLKLNKIFKTSNEKENMIFKHLNSVRTSEKDIGRSSCTYINFLRINIMYITMFKNLSAGVCATL